MFCWLGEPIDSTNEILEWIEDSGKFKDMGEFHSVCEKCFHCQWSMDAEAPL